MLLDASARHPAEHATVAATQIYRVVTIKFLCPLSFSFLTNQHNTYFEMDRDMEKMENTIKPSETATVLNYLRNILIFEDSGTTYATLMLILFVVTYSFEV